MLNRVFTPGTIGSELVDVFAPESVEPAPTGGSEAIFRRVLRYCVEHETDDTQPAHEVLFFRLTTMS